MKKRPLCVICLCLIAAQVLLVVTGVRKVTSVISPPKNAGNLSASGQVFKREEKSEYQILYLKNANLNYQNQENSNLKIIVYDEKFSDIRLGNYITVHGKWVPFEEPRNPGNYNQKFYYEKQGIAAAIWADKTKVTAEGTWKLREYLSVFCRKWQRMLCRVLGKRNGGMLSAMMLGERGEADRELKELYQINGIGHLLAISGLHLSFIGLSIYRLLKKAGLSYMQAGLSGVAILFLYALMTGFSVSSSRAFIMFAIHIGADISGRVYDMQTSLMVSAAVIVIIKPLWLWDAGFLFSFGAILAILFLYPIVRKCISFSGKWADAFAASLSVQLFLFPITLYFFFEIPLYSVLLNLIVIPLMSYLLGIGFIGSALYQIFPTAGAYVLKSSGLIFRLYYELCQKTLALPHARWVAGKPQWWQVFLSYLFLAIFICRVGKHFEKWHRYRVFVVLTGILMLSYPGRFGKAQLQVAMVDVGQGDGIFLKSPAGTTYFVDGGSSDVKNVGKYRIEPFLKSQGVGKLDYVLISHGDADHMSGIEEMLERQKTGIKIKTLVLTEKTLWDEHLRKLAKKALRYGTKVVTIKENQQLTENGFSITCIFPTREYQGEIGNASSMVLAVKYGFFDMLLTGDIEGEGEDVLKELKLTGDMEVLKVAHHGSKNSTGEEMLANVSPRFALISAGRGNRYGHPHRETLQRLKKCGAKIYNTQKSGCIMLQTDGRKIKITPTI